MTMQKVLITGGTSGIGLALAKSYWQQGAFVAMVGRTQKNFLHATQMITGVEGAVVPERLIFYAADVCDRAAMAQLMNDFFYQQGGRAGIDLVIASAGIALFSKSVLPDFVRAREIMDVNVGGLFNTFEPVITLALGAPEGAKSLHLVALASVAGLVGLPQTGAYSASKAAVLKFCETLAIDLARFGIRVTTIAPGFIDTPLTQKNQHKMPFLMSAQEAGERIKRAIEQQKFLYIFPWPMKILMLVATLLPRPIYVRVMRVVAPILYKSEI